MGILNITKFGEEFASLTTLSGGSVFDTFVIQLIDEM
jgi:hypothetical protein